MIRRASKARILLRHRSRRHAIPVYGIQNDKPVQDRTGVLLAIADQGFLVTAAHELGQITKAQIPLYVTSPRRGEGGIPLVGQLHATEEETIDVAVVKMNQETKALLDDAGARFLRVVDVDNSAAAIPALYLVRGYLRCSGSDGHSMCLIQPVELSNERSVSCRKRRAAAAGGSMTMS